MPEVGRSERTPFRGFQSPSYTPVPDELFDELLVELSGAELKVLLYIVRRTFGFKRVSDNISLSQMLNGIQTRDGRPLDRGVGLSKKTLLLALRTLRERGIVLAEWRQSADKGNEPTSYRLNVIGATDLGESDDADDPAGPASPADSAAGSESSRERDVTPLGGKSTPGGGGESTPPLGEKVHQGEIAAKSATPSEEKLPLAPGGKSTPGPRGKKYTTQETVLRKTGTQETAGLTPRFDLTSLHINKEASQSPELREPPIYVQPRYAEPRPAPHWAWAAPPVPDDPRFGSPARGSPDLLLPGRQLLGSAQIVAQIEQLSGELHDEDHLSSNVGQACRLWQASGLDEAVFADRMLEARSITKQRVIHKAASGELGELGLRNKMPYFFSVLRGLLGMAD